MEAKQRVISNEYRTSVLAINAYDDKTFEAEIYNEYLGGTKEVYSIQELIKTLDMLLDDLGCPMESMAKRSFIDAPEDVAGNCIKSGKVPSGKVATFAIQISYRSNATWQGSVTWIEKGTKEFFRSALELFFLLDSVSH